MNNIVFLLSKDCLPCEELPCYGGGKYWIGKTPNIDELTRKGTQFMRHYTAAPSTSMSMSAMLTGHYPYEFAKRKHYAEVTPSEYYSIFDEFQNRGYNCHVIWDKTWINMAWKFVKEFGDENKTVFHNLDIAQATCARRKGDEKLRRNDELLRETKQQIYAALESIDYSKKQFVWMHLPHILKGRCSYHDDIDVFDEIIGRVRELVGDDSIYLTSDHGHMNMHKHKLGYGFDVYEPAIRIPLITPKLDCLTKVDSITTNIDIPKIIFEGIIPTRRYVISDTKYYAQSNRKLSITGRRFKYIFNAKNAKEELYDLEWDPNENFNILEELFYDKDRKKKVFSIELYFYPYYSDAMSAYPELQSLKNEIWKNGTFFERLYVKIWKKASTFKKLIKN